MNLLGRTRRVQQRPALYRPGQANVGYLLDRFNTTVPRTVSKKWVYVLRYFYDAATAALQLPHTMASEGHELDADTLDPIQL